MSFPLQGFYFFIIFFLVFFNQLSKFLFFWQTTLIFTSNKCFFHFNVQQLLSNISDFVLFSQGHLKIRLKAKTFEKICFTLFYWISNTKEHFTLFFFWGGGGVLITAGGQIFLFKKNKQRGPGWDWGEAFIQDLRVVMHCRKYSAILHSAILTNILKTVKFDLGNSYLLKFHNKNIRQNWILPCNSKKKLTPFLLFFKFCSLWENILCWNHYICKLMNGWSKTNCDRSWVSLVNVFEGKS